MELSLTDLEQAINHWRGLRPSSGDERALSTEVNVLANVYAHMIFHKMKAIPFSSLDETAQRLIESWRVA
jgi:hypothetical protein